MQILFTGTTPSMPANTDINGTRQVFYKVSNTLNIIYIWVCVLQFTLPVFMQLPNKITLLFWMAN